MPTRAERDSLLQWINSFDTTCTSLGELSDGIVLFSIMHQIDSNLGNPDLLKRDLEDNWALKSSNLRLLVRAIDQFYREDLGQLAELESIDLSKISRESDEDEIAKLIVLILGCAVQCDDKETYIRNIMTLDESTQASLMHIISAIMNQFQPSSPRRTLNGHDENNEGSSQVNGLDLTCQLNTALDNNSILETTVINLKKELSILQLRNDELVEREKYLTLKDHKDEKVNMEEERRNSVEQKEALRLQRMTDAQIQELQTQVHEKDLEIEKIKLQSTERLQLLECEVRRQADELDISRSKVVQLGKLESTLSKYKAKLEESGLLKQQLKEIEDQNTQYLDKILDLEATIKTIPTLKSTIEKYKDQVVELETKNIEATSDSRVKDQKILRLQEDIDSALGGKEFLEEQLEALRSELERAKNQHDHFTSLGGGGGGGGSFGESVSDLKEKIMRLERENKNLTTEGNSTSNTQLMLLTNELDDAKRIKLKLEETCSSLKQRNLEIEGELEALKTHFKSSETIELTRKNDQLHQEISSLKEALKSNDASNSQRATIEELTNRLKMKESMINQLTSEKEKLENYTKKTLHAVQAKFFVNVETTKNQLTEQREKVNQLQEKLDRLKDASKKEEALLMSCFYEIGNEMQRRSLQPLQQPPTSLLGRMRNEEKAKRNNL